MLQLWKKHATALIEEFHRSDSSTPPEFLQTLCVLTVLFCAGTAPPESNKLSTNTAVGSWTHGRSRSPMAICGQITSSRSRSVTQNSKSTYQPDFLYANVEFCSSTSSPRPTAATTAFRLPPLPLLVARPHTMAHSGIRRLRVCLQATDSEFAAKFKFIDWQTYAGAPPGVEMTQMLAGSIAPVEDMDNLQEILDTYLDALYTAEPKAKVYTMEMLKEDFAMATTMLVRERPSTFTACPCVFTA